MKLPNSLKQFGDVLIDSYFIVDMERNIVDFNRTFYSMLPRSVARTLKSKKCYEVLKLEICKDRCIAKECWATQGHVRLDEISGSVEGQEGEMRFILSAIPIRDDAGNLIGAMEMQRNVTDEAIVQTKYQQQVESTERRLKQLEDTLSNRTRRLLEVGNELAQAQRALLRAKTELFK